MPHLPSFWTTTASTSGFRLVDVTGLWKDRIQELMTETAKVQFIGQGRDNRGLKHKGYEVARVHRVENARLWRSYAHRRADIIGSNPGQCAQTDVSTWKPWWQTELHQNKRANEVFLFHGTKPGLEKIIVSAGFEERVCSTAGLFGAAIYLAENSSKSDEYCMPDNGGTCFMFLVRASLGTAVETRVPRNGLRRPPCVNGDFDGAGRPTICSHPRADSVVAPFGPGCFLQKYREFMIYDRHQVYPELLIEFKRV